MEPVTSLEDTTDWHRVSKSTDTRYASPGSPLAESLLPPISKPVVLRSASGHSPEPSTPRRLSRSRGLSQSQNSLTRARIMDAGDAAHVKDKHNFTLGYKSEKNHNPPMQSNFLQPQENWKRVGNARMVPQISVNKTPRLAHDWLAPVISVGSIDSRAIKFLSADNTLHSSPTSRRKAKTTIPSRTSSTNPPASPVAPSPVKRIATDSRERFHLRLSHSPGPVNSPITVTSQTKGRNKLFQKDQNQRVQQDNSLEKTVSIRRKIEQYRKKFDEQYTDKLKRLKLDGEQESQHARPNSLPYSGVDFAQILESRIRQDLTPLETPPQLGDHLNGDAVMNAKNKDSLLTASSLFEHRPMSGVTWKTWRDVNDSDAYNDVAKYIHDNDLMDAEREQWIKAWIEDVEAAMKDVDQNSETILVDYQLN